MAHPQQIFFVNSVRQNLPDWFTNKRVLEIGSLDINGSVRSCFQDCDYTGIDVAPGKAVDRVCRGEDMDSPASFYDVIISCEMMEHNPQWKKTWLNMLRMLKQDGLMVMTCATVGRRRHGTPDSTPIDSPLTSAEGSNYYVNLVEEDFLKLTDLTAWFSCWGFFTDFSGYDLYFIGMGSDTPDTEITRLKYLLYALEKHYNEKNINGRW